MVKLEKILQSRWLSVGSGILLGLVWMVFAYAHMQRFLQTRELQLILFCVAETITVGFFIFRQTPKTVSIVPLDWIFAIVGTLTPLFLRPSDWGILPQAKYIMMVGMIIQMLSIISLNRSFALVAAKREIKTSKMYRWVRHPIYASYVLIFTGYILSNTTLFNVCLYTVTILCMLLRIVREEKHLAADPLYRDYMLKVRYRLIPYII
jgi:protein-S-isoprenylcysteine O-methyltransferase Ste14